MTAARVALAVILILPAAPPAAPAPAWLKQAAAGSTSVDAAAVVLLDEVAVTVISAGRTRTRRRYAARVADRAGRDAASLFEPYLTGSGRVHAARGWLLRDGEPDRELGRDAIADLAAVNNDVYNEVRVRAVSASEILRDGDVFGAEIEIEDRVPFSQVEWPMQGRWPVQVSRRSLSMPAGWEASSVTFNAPEITPAVTGSVWTWELRGLPEIPDEPAMPPLSAIVPRVAVSYFAVASRGGEFRDWAGVGTWLAGLSAASGGNEAVARKARQLAEPASSDIARIAAIAEHAQSVQYVSIQTGIGRGGGYAPRPAALVLEKNYGDCKDKANLARAMLEVIGVKSHLVSVYSGDRTYVRREWPSPQQFNHAIIAIELHDVPAEWPVIRHPSLGTLLFFDPTDPHTPVGGLPAPLQGSLALIVASGVTDLTTLPAAPGQDRIEQTIEGAIDEHGTLRARLRHDAYGAMAAGERAAFAQLEPAAYREQQQRRLGAIGNVRVSSLTPADEGTRFVLDAQLESASFLQRAGGMLLMQPLVGLGAPSASLTASTRRTPVLMQRGRIEEAVSVRLPGAFAFDGAPPSASLDTPYGRYELTYALDDATLSVTRTLVLFDKLVQPSEQEALRAFVQAVRAADTSAVLLKPR